MMEDFTFKTIYPEDIYSISPAATVVLDVPWTSLNADNILLLSKILGSIHLSLNSVRVVYQPIFDLASWREKPSRLIAFINPPAGIAPYELIQTPGTSMIISEPLARLACSEPSKLKFWSALQTLVAP